ncbi:Uncharacterized protein FWK35_00020877 [Aphis craccivora]|uniref:Uncharacterized protein n=1 Tax=Aphis craccivora TaxID=307492 RepID=A0A6G0YGJ5_APHCR|nr:Uncharacterized protein FWK35_00020877 [Aphis craccivora]
MYDFFFTFLLIGRFLDSERNDECIDLTKLCVFYFYFFFFVSVYTRKSRNNVSISNFEGGFR